MPTVECEPWKTSLCFEATLAGEAVEICENNVSVALLEGTGWLAHTVPGCVVAFNVYAPSVEYVEMPEGVGLRRVRLGVMGVAGVEKSLSSILESSAIGPAKVGEVGVVEWFVVPIPVVESSTSGMRATLLRLSPVSRWYPHWLYPSTSYAARSFLGQPCMHRLIIAPMKDCQSEPK